MCLAVVNKTYPENKKRGLGYKVVYKRADGYESIYYNSHLIPGSWSIALTSFTITVDGSQETYPSGFHFYKRLKDAKLKFFSIRSFYTRRELNSIGKRLRIIKIEYKDLMTEGKERTGFRLSDVKVAKKIRFIKEVKVGNE